MAQEVAPLASSSSWEKQYGAVEESNQQDIIGDYPS